MLNSGRKWATVFLISFYGLLFFVGALTVIVDPYFHYHKPIDSLQYEMNDERYQNNGIVKNFVYDAIITGTSMTQNFKATELDKLFGVQTVKVTFNGASYKEINDNLVIALEKNPDIKMIVRCLDYNYLIASANQMNYAEETYPRYLYDDWYYNDVKYIFNKSVLFGPTYRVLEYTKEGGKTTTFDEYKYWGDSYTYGRDAVAATYTRPDKVEKIPLSENDYKNIQENLMQNVIALAKENPEVDFYLYFSPYSIYFWDKMERSGTLEKYLDAEKYAIELLLQCENIHLFSFQTQTDIICNLDNYKDTIHYSPEINSYILSCMKSGENEITYENYEEYCLKVREFYMNYDYDKLFEDNEAS